MPQIRKPEDGSHSIFDPQPTVNSYYTCMTGRMKGRCQSHAMKLPCTLQNFKAVVSVTSQLPSSWIPKVDVSPGGHEASLDAIQRQMCVIYPIKYHPDDLSCHFVLGPSNTSEI